MRKIKIYKIDTQYVKWLLRFDENVMHPKQSKDFVRLYVGIIIEINDWLYFAPLTHKSKKWIKFDDHIVLGNQDLGSICLNCMIPINPIAFKDLVQKVDFSKYIGSINLNARKYGLLLFNQYRYINRENINKRIKIQALKTHMNLGLKNPAPYSCDFRLLEIVANKWIERFKYSFIYSLINQYNLLKI